VLAVSVAALGREVHARRSARREDRVKEGAYSIGDLVGRIGIGVDKAVQAPVAEDRSRGRSFGG
jgi:hypothetical protein